MNLWSTLALASPVTWTGGEPAPTRVEITASTWDPISRGQIERLLPVLGDLDLAVYTVQEASDWRTLRSTHPNLHVGSSERPELADGMLGWVRILEDGRVRWERQLDRPDEDTAVRAVQAFRQGDKKTLRKLRKPPRHEEVAWPEEAGVWSVNDAVGQAVGLVAAEDPGSFRSVPYQPDTERTQPLVAYGTPDDNPLLAAILEHHGIQLDADGVQLGSTRIEAADPVLIAALPSPWNPDVPVAVYATRTLGEAVLNSVFHGPTAATITSRGEVVSAFGLAFEDGRLVGASVGNATLSQAEALADLQALNDQLVANYSGLPALSWAVEGGWSAHTERHFDQLRAQPSWPWQAYVDLVIDSYLAPVDDFHFTVRGSSEAGDEVRERLVQTLRPWFTDLRAVAAGDRFYLVDQDVVLDIDPVPDPHRVKPGVPYAFPTLAADGSPQFLIGLFADRAPESLDLDGLKLPVHRSRSVLDERTEPWGYTTDGPLPTVWARTMLDERMAGFQQGTAGSRDHPELVLDLRGNHGGSDAHAHRFMLRHDNRLYRLSSGSNLGADGRWTSWGYSVFSTEGVPWTGERLWVLIDGGVASAGETFAFLSSQLPQARVVGVPTAGCSENGNLRLQPPLPHSALVFRYGHTRFVWDDVRPVVEGRGTFPDVWLDEPDPIRFLAELP